MSKLTIDTKHEFTTGRGETETVAEALAWIEKHMSGEDEEGESTGPAYTPADLIVYAVRRLRALHKDNARISKGKAPSRIYTPRVAEISGAARNASERKEEAREALAKALHVTLTKPAPTKPAPTKPAPKGSPARGAQVKAKHEAKQARKAKVHADKGGASLAL